MHESKEEILQRVLKEDLGVREARLHMLMNHELAKCRLCKTRLDIKEAWEADKHSLPQIAFCPTCGLWFHTNLPEQSGDFSKRKVENVHSD